MSLPSSAPQYAVPAAGSIQKGAWPWWWILTFLGGMLAEGLASIASWHTVTIIERTDGMAAQGGFITGLGILFGTYLLYGIVFGVILGLAQWVVIQRFWLSHQGRWSQGRWSRWLMSWILIATLEKLGRELSQGQNGFVYQIGIIGLVLGLLAAVMQLPVLSLASKAQVWWLMASGGGLFLGHIVFKASAGLSLYGVSGIHGSEYYLGRCYQWAIYATLTAIALEWLLRSLQRKESITPDATHIP